MARVTADAVRRLRRLDPRHDPRIARGLAGLAAAGVALVLLKVTGTMPGIRAALLAIGFDEPRAILIADLVAAGVAGAAAAAISGSRLVPAVVGGLVVAGAFGPHFLATVSADAAGHPPGTRIDPAGIARSTLAFLIAGVAAAWTAGLVAIEARGAVLGAWRAAAAARREPAARREAPRRAAVVAAVAILLAVAIPTLSDMLNYEPDADVLAGAPLATTGPTTDTPQPTGSDQVAISPTGSPVPESTAPPWAAWRPSGPGTLRTLMMAAPWTGGVQSTIRVDVYLPPGYATSTRNYPTLTIVPWAVFTWNSGTHMTDALNALMDSGAIPASIVVWVDEFGGPWADTECIDSPDGRERMETFISRTLPAFLDATYRTIPSADARTVLGASQGGYCAADLLVREPGVFHHAVAFSGYYVAAPANAQTRTAAPIFGGDVAALASHSPLTVVGTLPAAARAVIDQILVANPAQPFYGPQMVAYAAALRAAGVRMTVIEDALGHSWAAVEHDLGTVLRIVADAQAAQGVFR